MKRIKTTYLIFAFLMGALSAAAQDTGQMKIPLENPSSRGSLKVDINSGSITVTGTNVNEVIVNYTSREQKVKDKDKDKTNSSAGGLKKISSNSIDLEARQDGNRVIVESDSWSKGVDLDIQVPVNFDLELEGYNNGDIYAKNINGDVEADNYNGRITLENISGSAVADTYNGAIRVTFDAVTPDTPMAFTTYNGHVDLTFPPSTKASFKMKSKHGDIYEGFDMPIEESKPIMETERSKSGQYKVKVDDWVRGSINGGGAMVTIQNYNGNIFIRKGN